MLHYSTLLRAPRASYGRVARFFGLPLPDAELDAAVAETSVDAMKAAEKVCAIREGKGREEKRREREERPR